MRFQRLFILTVMTVSLMFLTGCDDSGSSGQSGPFTVGDTGPSGTGIVFYIEDGGMHGIEAARSNAGNALTWSAADAACRNIGSGWQLPSFDELKQLYAQRLVVGNFIITGTSNSCLYWSSTGDATSACTVNFSNGAENQPGKTTPVSARAIRKF